MKNSTPLKRQSNRFSRARWAGWCAIGTVLLAGPLPVRAADSTNAPSQADLFEGNPDAYKNWVEFSAGGLLTRGSASEAQQSLHLGDGAFGGIEDLHYQQTVATNTTLTVDGHSIFDNHDYSVSLQVRRENLGFVRAHFENFRTWYNGAGGFYPGTGTQYNLPDDTLTLDRGEISFEAGLRLEKAPQITFKYSHRYRDGDKSSTEWGPTHPDPLNAPTAVRGLAPSFYDVDETIDAFDLSVAHHVKATDFGGNLHYETADLNDARKTTYWPGEPTQQRVTDRQDTTYDQFSVNAFSETWINKNLFFSSGFLYSHLNSDFSGSRIYGNDYDVVYSPNPAQTDFGYTNLDGSLCQNDYVMNLNLMAKVGKDFTVVPSLRVQKEDWNADSSGWGTLSTFPAEDFAANSERCVLDVTEGLDLRYTGVTNWIFYGKGLWTQGEGNLNENGGLAQVAGFGVPPVQFQTDDSRFLQKYSAGARWYPLRAVTLDLGGYYKNHHYDYNFGQDNTPNNAGSPYRYPGYLVMQGFETFDGNFRLTLRLPQNVTLTGRYEYQYSTIDTEPDPASGLPEVQSAEMTTHIVALNASWVPWSRLYLQPGINYVWSETKTPASDYVPAALSAAPVLAAQNNYWTADLTAGFVVDDRTDLNVSYFYYRADDYTDNSSVGVPYGAGAEEHGVTAGIVRRINKNLRLTLKYGFYHYTDDSSGGNNNFDAHLVYSSLQYRF